MTESYYTAKAGKEVAADDLIVFCPGNKPIRVVRFHEEKWDHPTIGAYRIFDNARDEGYSLFDEQTVWSVKQQHWHLIECHQTSDR